MPFAAGSNSQAFSQMESVGLTGTTEDFYDRLNYPSRLALRIMGVLLIATFLLTTFLWSADKFFLLISCVAGLVILLSLPRVLRGAYLAYRGAPALRVNEQGFWAREWSYLGWVSWSDVASVEVEGQKICQLVVHLRDKEFAQLAGHDQVAVMLARLEGFLFFTDTGPNTLRLISSSQLTSRWENLTATLDPILVANGFPRLDKRLPA
jgi:hypothetical protein